MTPEARWRRDVWRVFERGGLKPAEINAAMILAAVAAIGTDPSALSTLTGLSVDYVRKVTTRLRQQRILRGQTIRVAWMREHGDLAAILDGCVAAGRFTRASVDEKRSAAQKARRPETYARGPRRPRTTILPGAVFTPKQQIANPLYGLPEWEQPKS